MNPSISWSRLLPSLCLFALSYASMWEHWPALAGLTLLFSCLLAPRRVQTPQTPTPPMHVTEHPGFEKAILAQRVREREAMESERDKEIDKGQGGHP